MEQERYTRIDAVLIIFLIAATLAAAIAMAMTVTERLPHLEDEIAYLFQAQTFARGELWAPAPPAPTGFFTPFVVMVGNDRRVGKYPIGWPLVLALGEAVNAGWLVNPVLAAVTIALIYALGKELYGRQVGLVAAVLALTSPLFLLQSSTFMSHPIAALWATLLAWAFLRADIARETGREACVWSAVCGLAIGMLAITRPLTAVAVVMPFAVVLLVRLLRSPRAIGEMVRSYWPLGVLSLVVIALQFVYTTVLTGDPTTNLYLKVWAYDRIGFGPGYGRGDDGHTLAKAWRTAQVGMKNLAGDLFGWPGLSWVPLIPGLAFGAVRASLARRHWPLLLLFPTALLIFVHMAYWVGAEVYGPRYYYEGHAGMAILAAVGICGTIRLLMAGIKRLASRSAILAQRFTQPWLTFERGGGLFHWDNWLVYPVLGALLAVNFAGYLPGRLAEWHALYGITRAPLDQLAELQQTNNVLVLIRGGHWQDYAPFFSLNNPWYDGTLVAVHDNASGRAAELTRLFPGREIWFYNAETRQFSQHPSPYIEAKP
jgi:dolichyl-phosphate-mannose-protein mannosyltransferase